MDIKKYIDTHFDEVLKSIIEIIRIKTVKADRAGDAPYGEELKKDLTRCWKLLKGLVLK